MQNIKTIKEIYLFLDSISPFKTQEEWDNSGLMIGKFCNKIENIYTCLEVTKEIAIKALENSLIISHHPLIFKPFKNINFDIYPNNIIEILIKKNISLISIHTNFDLSHLNEYFCAKILGFNNFERDSIACIVEEKMDFLYLLNLVQNKFENNVLRFVKANDKVYKIAIICGAGFSEIDRLLEANLNLHELNQNHRESRLLAENANFDCIITGDIKYHDAMKFKSLGISIIDVGHYESERHFGEVIALHLKKINYNAIIADSKNPFSFNTARK